MDYIKRTLEQKILEINEDYSCEVCQWRNCVDFSSVSEMVHYESMLGDGATFFGSPWKNHARSEYTIPERME